jgi:hypothetical protein
MRPRDPATLHHLLRNELTKIGLCTTLIEWRLRKPHLTPQDQRDIAEWTRIMLSACNALLGYVAEG